MGFRMSLDDLQGWLRGLAGWLAGWGHEEGKVQGLESQGYGVGNNTLKCCFREMLSRHRCGVEMERLEVEKHKDSYVWRGTEEGGLDGKRALEWSAKAHGRCYAEGTAKGLKKGALSKAK